MKVFKSKERNAVNEFGDHLEISLQRFLQSIRGVVCGCGCMGEEGPSCRGHECGLAALPLVRLLHILTPRIFGHSVHTHRRERKLH